MILIFLIKLNEIGTPAPYSYYKLTVSLGIFLSLEKSLRIHGVKLKLEAAQRAGFDKAITFEFSHFLSPQSVYGAAGNLYNRYREYFGI